MIVVKDLRSLGLDDKLVEVVEDLFRGFGEMVITSTLRPGDKGVHGTVPVRGIDLRCRNISFGRLVETFINSRWVYDPRRESLAVCICHDTGRGLHLHLQVHPETRRR